MLPVALSIAGSDPSGGAGIQADLKTFHHFGVYGEAVITLLTVQNTVGVRRVECVAPELVVEQLEAVLDDIPPQAAKTGALGNASIVTAIADAASRFDFPLVVDPVMVSKHGAALLGPDAAQVLREKLIPRAALVMPNLPETEQLLKTEVRDLSTMKDAAQRLCEMGARAALVKGGHREGDATDVLYHRGEWRVYEAPRLDTPHTHGTGCTYAAAITAELAKGTELADAVTLAKSYLSQAIATNPGLGRGCGPVNHHAGRTET